MRFHIMVIIINIKNMYIQKCDLCKKEVPRGEGFSVVYENHLIRPLFCEKCGKPVAAFLKKNKFIK